MRDTVPALERTLEARVRPPVVATQSGFASVSRALQEESLSATERAELLAAPLLLLVLLLVFRSVVAAAIPLALRRAHRLRRPRRPRPAQLGDDDRRALAGRLHDDGAGPRGRLLAADRLPLPRGARRRARPLGGRAAARGQRRAARPSSPAPPCSSPLVLSAFLQPGSLLLSLATTVGVVTVISVLVASLACPPCWPCSASASTPAAIGRAAARPLGPLPRRRGAALPRRCAAPASPRPDRGAAGAARRCRPSPSPPAPRGSTSCRPPTTPARAPKTIDRGRRPRLGGALRPRRRDRARPDHDPARGSRCCAAGSGGSPAEPGVGR